jgi:hypothetical protein
MLRGSARRKAGGLDAASYASWYAALIDLSLRLSGLGWRNALCETAFVARGGEGGPADGDLDALAARWPAWHARLANFLMHDPLAATRGALSQLERDVGAPQAQRDLFQAQGGETTALAGGYAPPGAIDAGATTAGRAERECPAGQGTAGADATSSPHPLAGEGRAGGRP